ncbi:MAG: diacylglycerol O-acyltransferase / wax synthase [Acidimicrobiaceae bacterium]
MNRLSGLDASFLYMEKANANSHMHVAFTIITDPSTVEGGYSFDKVLDLVRERLPLVPPFRRRLVDVPFGLHHPVWIEDPDFDLEYHVRRAALPAPGGKAELAEFAADVMSRPLDHDRPLWEMYIVEGLEDGQVASVVKTHHAAIDGVAGTELAAMLLDIEPTPAPRDIEDLWQSEPVPSDASLVANAMADLAVQPVRVARAARRLAERTIGMQRWNRRPESTSLPGTFAAPPSILNVAITGHRRVAFTELALADIKTVKSALGGTVNDVVLAVCAGALRGYLEKRGELPDEPLVAMVPVSVRTDETLEGNQVTAMMAPLATDIADPTDRLHAITAATRDLKEREKAVGATSMTEWADVMSPSLAALAGRLTSRLTIAEIIRPQFNVTISNVPGPPIPLYCAGAKLTALYPLGPIPDGAALNITVISYLEHLFVGVVADRDALPDVDDLAAALNDALAELLAVSTT